MLIVDINAKIIVAGYSTEYFLLLNGREKPTQAKTVTDSALKALKTITDNMTLRNKLGNSWAWVLLLVLHALTAKGIAVGGTEIPRAVRCSPKREKKQVS